MRLAIYSRDDQGLITQKGVEEWDSPYQMLEEYRRDDYDPELEQMLGWPDAEVIWHGNTGYAIRENDHGQN